MYIAQSIIDGLKILGFDKQTVKKVSREKDVEEIFLTSLFLNYIIVLIAYIIGNFTGGYYIGDRMLNPTAVNALLMIYPFVFNLVIYFIYGGFGMFAEIVNPKKHVKPLLSVGFHTAVVYSVLFYIFALLATIDVNYALFLFLVFGVYFLAAMVFVTHVTYGFSTNQSIIVVLSPFLFLSLILLVVLSVWPASFSFLLRIFF
jgi:cation transport ATPase